MFGVLDISTSGLIAQRTRLDVASANIAGSRSITDAQGNYSPFRRRIAVFAQGDPATGSTEGVHVARIELDSRPPRMVYDPGSPFADAQGYVGYPSIDPTFELVDGIEASRAYEANIVAAEATKAMIQASLRLLA